jgi:hypothetical protein
MMKNLTTSQRAARDRNAAARKSAMGIRDEGTFNSSAAAIEAIVGWGLAAHANKIELSSLAGWIDRSEPEHVKAKLLTRGFMRRAIPDAPDDLAEAIDRADPADVLRLFIVDGDEDSADSTLSLHEMMQAVA